jgi:proteasome lid subunit RPN8/RPN11
MTDLSGRSDADSRAAIAEAQGRRSISIEESAREAMHQHAAGTTSVEIGGVLVGEVDDDTGDVFVTAAIPAHQATSAVASLTFTHEAWDEVNDVMSRDFEDQRMVGWYHSHPRFGIFLSEYDVFIHKNFFREDWQVAYVVDPVSQTSGVFGWEHGDIVRYSLWNIIVRGAAKSVREPDRGGPARRSPNATLAEAAEPVAVHLDEEGPAHAKPRRQETNMRLVMGGLAALLVAAVAVGLWLALGSSNSPAPSASADARSTHPTTTPHARSTPEGALGGSQPSGTLSGTFTVSGSDDNQKLTERWAWQQTAGLGYDLYSVTISLATGAGDHLGGTVLQCAPFGMVPANDPTRTIAARACNLSSEGSYLQPGQSELFVFVPLNGFADSERIPTPTYTPPNGGPPITDSAVATSFLPPQSQLGTSGNTTSGVTSLHGSSTSPASFPNSAGSDEGKR